MYLSFDPHFPWAIVNLLHVDWISHVTTCMLISDNLKVQFGLLQWNESLSGQALTQDAVQNSHKIDELEDADRSEVVKYLLSWAWFLTSPTYHAFMCRAHDSCPDHSTKMLFFLSPLFGLLRETFSSVPADALGPLWMSKITPHRTCPHSVLGWKGGTTAG